KPCACAPQYLEIRRGNLMGGSMRDLDLPRSFVSVVDAAASEVDADAEVDPTVLRHVSVTGDHAFLHLNGPAHCIHDGGKLNQDALAGRFGNAPQYSRAGRSTRSYGLRRARVPSSSARISRL